MNKNIVDPFTKEALYEASLKTPLNVSWKPSVKYYNLFQAENAIDIGDKLASGKWKNGRPKPIQITYPKRRDGLSIPYKDRVYQRSLNDNVLYPLMTRSFIYDNGACQKGKGADFTRKRLKKHLWNYYTHYGNSGYVLHIDIKSYYASMNHALVNKMFQNKLPKRYYKAVESVLNHQYQGSVGYNPGSQMVQIAGISFLDPLDHFLKEKLKVKYYIRYMDDLLILHPDKDVLKQILHCVKLKLNDLKLKIHPNKTKIKPLSCNFGFLGFNYRLTDTGKVIMLINGKNVKHEKQKLKKMVAKVISGDITVEKVLECYTSWRSHASKGNNYRLLKKMDTYLSDLLQGGLKYA